MHTDVVHVVAAGVDEAFEGQFAQVEVTAQHDRALARPAVGGGGGQSRIPESARGAVDRGVEVGHPKAAALKPDGVDPATFGPNGQALDRMLQHAVATDEDGVGASAV